MACLPSVGLTNEDEIDELATRGYLELVEIKNGVERRWAMAQAPSFCFFVRCCCDIDGLGSWNPWLSGSLKPWLAMLGPISALDMHRVPAHNAPSPVRGREGLSRKCETSIVWRGCLPHVCASLSRWPGCIRRGAGLANRAGDRLRSDVMSDGGFIRRGVAEETKAALCPLGIGKQRFLGRQGQNARPGFGIRARQKSSRNRSSIWTVHIHRPT